jgi:hypothetical protein
MKKVKRITELKDRHMWGAVIGDPKHSLEDRGGRLKRTDNLRIMLIMN